ncbi:PilZ domain-containing protein [Aliiruegeria sabulilitoris]|uniref:PilZ domain-containing protein n=1 Tax=Aliiruegeria sabulilitoris TaxID=1510458 RepID=UPI0013D6E258|nr:PilZ domain-containing protein [Aliiruegeria sabulilitoris]
MSAILALLVGLAPTERPVAKPPLPMSDMSVSAREVAIHWSMCGFTAPVGTEMQPGSQQALQRRTGVIRIETCLRTDGAMKPLGMLLSFIASRLLIAIVLLWLPLANSVRAGADSLLCGFLIGFGSTEKTIVVMVEHLSSNDAINLAHSESRMLDSTFLRFKRWYPDIAVQIEPYVRSRQEVFHGYITGGAGKAAARYLGEGAFSSLENLEKTLSTHGCSVPFNRVEAMSQMQQHASVVREEWGSNLLRGLRGAVPLTLLSAACIGGLVAAFFYEARSRLRQIRYLVSVSSRLLTPSEVHSCRIRDISRRGAKLFFEEPPALALNQAVTLFAVETMVSAQVRWASSKYIGVEFKPLVPRPFLDNVISESRTLRKVRRRPKSKNT